MKDYYLKEIVTIFISYFTEEEVIFKYLKLNDYRQFILMLADFSERIDRLTVIEKDPRLNSSDPRLSHIPVNVTIQNLLETFLVHLEENII